MVDGIGARFKGYAPFLLRLGLSIIVIMKGAQDLQGLGRSPGAGALVSAIVLLLGGLFILIGFLTRWAALGLSIVVLIHVIQHEKLGLITNPGSGHYWLALLMMSLALFCAGGGDLSVDQRQKRKEDK